MARRSAKSKTVRKVDFSQEVEYFEPDAEYAMEVKSAEWADGNEHPYIAIQFKGVDEEFAESTLYHNATTSPKALNRLRALLEALGIDVPEKGEAMDLDVEELVGKQCMVHTYEDNYEGKKNVKADDFWPIDEKKSKGGAKGKAGGKGKKEEVEDEKIARDDVEGLSRKKLIALIEEHELDVDADARKLKKDDEALAEAVIEALEEKDLLAADEPEEKPARGKGSSKGGSKGSKGKSKTWTEDELSEMTEKQLDKVVEEAELELDMSEFGTLRKKRNALLDALEEADRLEK